LGCSNAAKNDQNNKYSKFVSVKTTKVYEDEWLASSPGRFTRGEIVPRRLRGSHIRSGCFEEETSPLLRPGIEEEFLDIPETAA
jgi:hypothetical protein